MRNIFIILVLSGGGFINVFQQGGVKIDADAATDDGMPHEEAKWWGTAYKPQF